MRAEGQCKVRSWRVLAGIFRWGPGKPEEHRRCVSWREIGVRKWRVELQREHCARGHTSAAAAERVSSVTNAQLARAADLPGVLVQHSDRSGDGPAGGEEVDQTGPRFQGRYVTAGNQGNNQQIRE